MEVICLLGCHKLSLSFSLNASDVPYLFHSNPYAGRPPGGEDGAPLPFYIRKIDDVVKNMLQSVGWENFTNSNLTVGNRLKRVTFLIDFDVFHVF